MRKCLATNLLSLTLILLLTAGLRVFFRHLPRGALLKTSPPEAEPLFFLGFWSP